MTSGGVPQTAANGQQIYETFSHKNKCKLTIEDNFFTYEV